MHMKKRYGHKGSPCLIPLNGVNLFDICSPFKRALKDEEVTNSMMTLIKRRGRFVRNTISLMNDHQRLSYAFS